MVQVKEVFSSIAPAVGLRVGLAVGQSSIADEISELIERPKLGSCSPFDPEDVYMELQTAVDILVATPGRLMDHINMTKGFSLEHLCYLVNEQIYIWITFSDCYIYYYHLLGSGFLQCFLIYLCFSK